jgi:hypothetical protein
MVTATRPISTSKDHLTRHCLRTIMLISSEALNVFFIISRLLEENQSHVVLVGQIDGSKSRRRSGRRILVQ